MYLTHWREVLKLDKMIKARWLIYTVLIGLLPFIMRLFVFLIFIQRDIDFLMNEADFIILGIILNLTNLNELENRNLKLELEIWKTKMMGLSAVQIAFYGGILGLSYFSEMTKGELIDKNVLFYGCLVCSLTSFFFSYSIFNRLNKSINSATHG